VPLTRHLEPAVQDGRFPAASGSSGLDVHNSSLMGHDLN